MVSHNENVQIIKYANRPITTILQNMNTILVFVGTGRCYCIEAHSNIIRSGIKYIEEKKEEISNMVIYRVS